MNLTEGQQRGLDLAGNVCRSTKVPRVGQIVGYAGTGKTTLLRAICDTYGDSIILTPTGKAALRVSEASGQPARTIHRWLYKPKENKETGLMEFTRAPLSEIEKPRSGMILVDEASMIGPEIWEDVLSVCTSLNIGIVLIGDGFQLPPVQPRDAEPFSTMTVDFAQTHNAQRVVLKEVLRQAQDSAVVRASMKLRDQDPVGALAELHRIPAGRFPVSCVNMYERDGVIIAHRNVTRHRINAMVRRSLGRSGDIVDGEPLLVLKNDYNLELFNGELVTFRGWDRAPNGKATGFKGFKGPTGARFGVSMFSGSMATLAVEQIHGDLEASETNVKIGAKKYCTQRAVFDPFGKTPPHLHANFGYCFTAHRAQGSQWPYVLVALERSIRLSETDGLRWAYTAITRAEKLAGVCTDVSL